MGIFADSFRHKLVFLSIAIDALYSYNNGITKIVRCFRKLSLGQQSIVSVTLSRAAVGVKTCFEKWDLCVGGFKILESSRLEQYSLLWRTMQYLFEVSCQHPNRRTASATVQLPSHFQLKVMSAKRKFTIVWRFYFPGPHQSTKQEFRFNIRCCRSNVENTFAVLGLTKFTSGLN
jgi:hypothetical protein